MTAASDGREKLERTIQVLSIAPQVRPVRYNFPQPYNLIVLIS
ncbi:hypothetical protein EVA_04752 [gut metagenome]|uniref:Uncharacterized protein n=1 Tax=gut metagenome TaxID=749906 RepID=J9H179_9ZZZZ